METLSVEEAADYLKISTESVERIAGDGTLKGGKIGKRWVFFREDLATYLRNVINEQTAARRDLLSQGKPAKVKTAMSTRKGRPVLPELPVMA